MAKERNFNPVQAHKKAEKAKAIKKGKAAVAASRNERLAKKNPERIQKQIEELKAITDGGGKLTSHEAQVLEGLEKEYRAVKKAREALGDNAPSLGGGGGGGGGGVLGKRRWEDKKKDDSSDEDDEDVPEEVRRIPMPRDTPPPIPKRVLDEWYAKRRAKWNSRNNNGGGGGGHGSHANSVPLGDGGGRGGGRGPPTGDSGSGPGNDAATTTTPPPPPAPKPVAKTVYEAKPVIRDLQKEAVKAFMPVVVQRKLEKARGLGGSLIEPEEADRLEKEGYLRSTPTALPTHPSPHSSTTAPAAGPRQTTIEDVDDEEEATG